MALPETIELAVVTPEGEIFRGEVSEVTLPGYDGYFGVLPGHEPLILVLSTGRLEWKLGQESGLAALSGGYAEILPDRVIVLADVGELALDIDVERANEARDRAEARLMGRVDGEWNLVRAQAALSRSLNRISVTTRLGSVGRQG